MTSKETEFITQWNGLLDYKIDEQNLRRPNFQFFYSALESLLRSLNFDLETAQENARAHNDPDRAYYIMFCAFVHRLYQLSDPSYNFYFFDLLNPTPKKSFHVLKMLFNYLKYYEMVKQNICEKANEVLKSYDDALETNNQLQIANETAKKRAQKMEIELDEYQRKLPEIRDRVNKYMIDIETLDKEIVQKNAEIKNFDSDIIKAEIKQSELSEAIVTEADYNGRVDKITEFERELKELRQVAEHIRSSNVGSNAKINELSDIIEILKKALDEQQISHYEELISLNTHLSTSAKEAALEEKRIIELKTNIKTLNENTNKVLLKLKQLELQMEKIQMASTSEIGELSRKKSHHEREIEQVRNELSELRSQLHQLEQQREFLTISIPKVLKLLSQKAI